MAIGDKDIAAEFEHAAFLNSEIPAFHKHFGKLKEELSVEKGRYRLIWTKRCPWATRFSIGITLLGLDSFISKGLVDPLRPAGISDDWYFTLDPHYLDPVLGTKSLKESYLKADPHYKGRARVPALVDVVTGQVVNNDHLHLLNELYGAWRPFWKKDAPDLYPEALQGDIDALDKILDLELSTHIDAAATARSQKEYEYSYDVVFHRLDWLENRLADRTYLLGDFLTDSDLRLYTILAWFDIVYYQKFFLNKKRIIDYPNLRRYFRKLYSIAAFKENTSFDHIKLAVYIGDHTPFADHPRLLPKGPELDWLLGG